MLRLGHRINQASDQAGNESFAVLFVDLNRFKHINDHYGHGIGDQVLIEIAQRLRVTVGPENLVARLSGDEFVVLLVQVEGQESLERMRLQIQDALKEPLMALGHAALAQVDFGGAVGEALFPNDGRDAESLLKKADRRMYSQKFAERMEGHEHPLRRVADQLEIPLS